MEKNASFLPDATEIKKEFTSLPRYSVYLIDEAVRGLWKYKWSSGVQQALLEMYQTERHQNKCTLLCIPRFKDFTEHFRNHRIKIWIHVLARDPRRDPQGVAIAYLRDDDKDQTDPWHLVENIKLKDKLFRNKPIYMRSLNEKINAERKMSNFYFFLEFADLPEDIKTEYVTKKVESRRQEQLMKGVDSNGEGLKSKGPSILEQKQMNQRDKLIKLALDSKLFTQEDLGNQIGLSRRTISDVYGRMRVGKVL